MIMIGFKGDIQCKEDVMTSGSCQLSSFMIV